MIYLSREEQIDRTVRQALKIKGPLNFWAKHSIGDQSNRALNRLTPKMTGLYMAKRFRVPKSKERAMLICVRNEWIALQRRLQADLE